MKMEDKVLAKRVYAARRDGMELTLSIVLWAPQVPQGETFAEGSVACPIYVGLGDPEPLREVFGSDEFSAISRALFAIDLRLKDIAQTVEILHKTGKHLTWFDVSLTSGRTAAKFRALF